MAPLRRLLLVMLALGTMLAPSDARAQAAGFKAGVSFSNLSPRTSGDAALTAFTGGGFVRLPFGGVALQPELMWVSKGVARDNYELRLDYVEIPLLVMLPIGHGTRVPFLYAGPALGFEVDCAFEAGAASLPCDDDGSVEADPLADFVIIDSRRRRTDIGGMLGAGVHLPLGPGALTLEGRYNFGLVNLNRGDGGAVRNRSGAVLASFAIFIGS